VSQPEIAKNPKALFWRSRSSKVINFGANQTPVYDFLLVINSNLGPMDLAPFLRYGDLLSKNRTFFTSSSHSAPQLGVTFSEFVKKLYSS